jgi:hypothetical protein
MRYWTRLDASSETGSNAIMSVVMSSAALASAHSEIKQMYPNRRNEIRAKEPRYVMSA